MVSKIFYKASVERDLKKVNKQDAKRILGKMERDLAKDPNKGESLKGNFQGLYRYRVGNYRIIYTKIAEGILVLQIGHRKEIYR